jgi:hypothetical protein
MLSLFFAVGCQKPDFDTTVTGEALSTFRLVAPSNNLTLALNPTTPNDSVIIRWTPSKPGVNTAPRYKWVAGLKLVGNLSNPLLELESDSSGKATRLTLTQKQIDDALASKGISVGAKTDFIWSVVADNGTTKVQSEDVFTISISRMKDGSSPFVLLGPSSSLTPLTINPTSTSESVKFNWTRSRPAAGSPAVTYRVLFARRQVDANGMEMPIDWSSPLFTVFSDNNGTDSLLTLSYKRFSDSLSANGFTSLPTPAEIKWTVVATSGTWSQRAEYVNNFSVVREVKVYIVGSATPGGWDILRSTRLIEDPRFPGTYFTYIYLIGSNEFKFVNGQAWPPAAGAIDWGQDRNLPAGNFTDQDEMNIQVPSTGVYRVTFDLSAKKFYLQTATSNGIGGMGMIGNFQGWSQPAVKMIYLGVNRFIYLTNMNNNDEFKFHDGNDWNNSTNILHRWYGIDNGRMAVDPGFYSTFKYTGPSGLVRSIWDGSNTLDLQYQLNSAAQMRVVGDGIQGVSPWDPGGSPQMNYIGNGVWTITLNLIAGKDIKFVAGNAWGAFDYEDNSNGSVSVGSPRSIKWDGGSNFKTPITSGTYTITLNEYAQTVRID